MLINYLRHVHSAKFTREDSNNKDNFVISVRKSLDNLVSSKNILDHVFLGSDLPVSSTEKIYLGRFQLHEEINVSFRNDTDLNSDLSEDVVVPIVCLKSDKESSELTLCGDGVELKIVFLVKEIPLQPLEETTYIEETGVYIPSSSSYHTIRSCVIAVANAKTSVNNTLDSFTGIVSYAVNSGKFILSVGFDLTRDFLIQLDIIFSESYKYINTYIDTTRSRLLDSLQRLTQQLQLRLLTADHIITEKITIILRKLYPRITYLARLLYPYVSLGVYLSRPFRTILQPYVQPVINKAINIHHNLHDYILIDTFVNCTIEKVQLV